MRDDVLRALSIDRTSTLAERTIDITTIGRRSRVSRRIEICFYRLENDIYLSGIPAPRARDWLVNLSAEPQFTFHLKNEVVADLPARAWVITNPFERERVLAAFVDDFNFQRSADSPWPVAELEEWVTNSPLARVEFLDEN